MGAMAGFSERKCVAASSPCALALTKDECGSKTTNCAWRMAKVQLGQDESEITIDSFCVNEKDYEDIENRITKAEKAKEIGKWAGITVASGTALTTLYCAYKQSCLSRCRKNVNDSITRHAEKRRAPKAPEAKPEQSTEDPDLEAQTQAAPEETDEEKLEKAYECLDVTSWLCTNLADGLCC